MTEPKLIKAHVDRLDLSEQVLARWEQMMELGATPAENLRLIESEIGILRRLLTDDPHRVADLIKRYEAVARRLRNAFH